jgi:uncharacterized repeat protein (TIGR01451 family)
MNKLIFLILSLVLLPGVLAYSGNKVFDDWVYNEDTITLDDKEFFFRLSNEGNKLLIISDGESQIMNLPECRNFDIQRRICFNDSYYDGAGEPSNRAYVIIYYRKPRLNITRTIDDNIFTVGDEVEFTVEINNYGEINAKDVYYEDVFPQNVRVVTSSGCPYTERKVYYDGDIRSGSYVDCKYTITTTAPVDSITVASVTYDTGFETVANYSDSIRLYSSSPLKINASFDNSSIQIEETTYFRINITNVASKDIDIDNILVTIPSGLEVISDNMINIDENNYKWSGTLSSNKSQLLVFKLKGKKTKGSEILTNINYEMDNKEYKISNLKTNIYIEDRGVSIYSNIDNNQRFDSNTQQTFSIFVRNENNHSKIKNLFLSLNSTLFPYDEYQLSTLGEESRAKVASVTMITPNLSTTKSYKLTANLTYETEYREKYSEKLERTFIIEPIKKVLITKTISPSVIEEGKEATVTVKIKNDRNERIDDVIVKEIFHGNFGQKGTTSRLIDNISQGKTITAYTYNIKAPNVINQTRFNFTTQVSYTKDGFDYLFTEDSAITVNPKKLKISVSKSVSDSSIYLGEIVDVRYTIKNEEEEPAKNFKLYFTDNQKVDTINEYNYFIERLNPGEEIIIDSEQIRPKKAEEKMIVGTSLYEYQDMDGAQFSSVSGSLTLKVQEGYMYGPVIWVEKKSDLYDIMRADEVEITITVSNIGDKSADVVIVDGVKSWNKNIAANDEEIITYKKRFYEPEEYTLDKVYAYYDYLGNEYRATSNVVKIKVTDVDIEAQEPVIIKDEEEEQVVIVKEEPLIEKENFFVRIWRTILNLF